MKKVIFKTLHIEGFISIIEPLIYKFDQPGLNLISGHNGAGKTQIFSALTWVAYGITLKNRKKNPSPYDWIKPNNFKGTLVKLSLEVDGVDYEIVRTYKRKKPPENVGSSGITIFKEGKVQQKNLRDLPDYQRYIDNLLGASYRVFTNTALFGQKLTRIIQETGPKRNEILEEAFEITFIKEGKLIAERKLQALRDETRDSERSLVELTREIASLGNSYKEARTTYLKARTSIEKLKKEARTVRKEEIVNLKAEKKEFLWNLGQTKRALEFNTKKQNAYEKHYSRYQDLSYRMEDLKTRRKENLKKIKTLNENLVPQLTVCPQCGTTLSKKKSALRHYKRERNLKVKALKRDNEQIDLNLESMTKQVKRLRSITKPEKNKLKKIELLRRKKMMLEVSIKNLKTKIKTLREKHSISGLKELLDLKEDNRALMNKFKSLRSLKKSEKKGLKLDLKPLMIQLKDLEWVNREALSNSGLKAFIINEMVESLNKRLAYYADFIGYQVLFSVNLDSKRKEFVTAVYDGEHEADYHDLSGGQAQLVDVAIAFAFHDLKTAETDYNILLMDEVFESLDEANVEMVTQFIKEKAKKKCVHLITHQAEFNSSYASITQVKLKNKKTVVYGS